MHRVRRILTAPVPDNGSGDVWPKVATLLLTASAKGVTQLSAAAHPCPAGGKQGYETKSAERQSPGSDAWQCEGGALGPAGCGLLLCHAIERALSVPVVLGYLLPRLHLMRPRRV